MFCALVYVVADVYQHIDSFVSFFWFIVHCVGFFRIVPLQCKTSIQTYSNPTNRSVVRVLF